MKTRICFAYPWATLGGCERVFINRALAFKKHFPGLEIDFLFLSDGGGLNKFLDALKKYGLNDIASVVNSLDKSYELLSLVDCPQLFPALNRSRQKYIIECHTGYTENRQYLSSIPRDCKIVATPSRRFSNKLRSELPDIDASIRELSNFVPWDIENDYMDSHIHLPMWNKRPVIFLGRLDRLKNPLFLLDAMEALEKKRKGEFFSIFCGPKSSEINLESEISRRGLSDISLLLPPIPFHATSSLMCAVRESRGVFVSTSRMESFGLSAAEAISSLLPPALSNIEAHLDLIEGFEDLYSFDLGSADSLSNRIEHICDNYSKTQDPLIELRDRLSSVQFMNDWIALVNEA